MQLLNCLIVEDEPLAADIIQDYILQVPGLTLKGICENAFEAMEKLRNEKVDIIFLDVNLPKLSGIDFIKTIKSNHHIILTTAYHKYALEGYDLNVTDYLLKPIEFSRFMQAVNKVLDKKGQVPLAITDQKKFFFFNVDKKRIKVFVEDIIYIESLKDYVRIHSSESKIVTKFQIGELESLLKEENFLRIHKSFIINPAKITSYNSSEVGINSLKIKIGRSYRKDVLSSLKTLNLIN